MPPQTLMFALTVGRKRLKCSGVPVAKRSLIVTGYVRNVIGSSTRLFATRMPAWSSSAAARCSMGR